MTFWVFVVMTLGAMAVLSWQLTILALVLLAWLLWLLSHLNKLRNLQLLLLA